MSILEQMLGALGGLGSLGAQAAQSQQFGHQRERMFGQARQAQQFYGGARQAGKTAPKKSQYDNGDVMDVEWEDVKPQKLIEGNNGNQIEKE